MSKARRKLKRLVLAGGMAMALSVVSISPASADHGVQCTVNDPTVTGGEVSVMRGENFTTFTVKPPTVTPGQPYTLGCDTPVGFVDP